MSTILSDPATGYRRVVGWPHEPPSAFHQSEMFIFTPPGPEDKKRRTRIDFLIKLYTDLERAEDRFEQWRRQGSFHHRLTRGASIPCSRRLHVQERMRTHRQLALWRANEPDEETARVNALLWWRTLPDLTIMERAERDAIISHEYHTHQWD